MKRIFILALAATTLFAFASCQKTEVTNGEANVTIEVGVPATKTISDGLTATALVYEIYLVTSTDQNNKNYTLVTEGTGVLQNLSTQVNFTLMRGSTYVALFWAHAGDNSPYNASNLRAVAMNYTSSSIGNNENRDAFYGREEFTVTDDVSTTCDLVRPFSQINFVATDYTRESTDDITNLSLINSTVTIYNLATSFDVLTGQASTAGTDSGSHSASFTATSIISEDHPEYKDATNTSYDWISMNYVLLPYDNNTVNVSAEFTVNATYKAAGNANPIEHVVKFPATEVSASPNYRTNIVGEIFTEGGNVSITVDPSYKTESYKNEVN